MTSFIGSALALLLLFAVFRFLAWRFSRTTAGHGCWWLPAWQCWRLVVRNIDGTQPFYDIAYRVWLREIIPAREGSSVKSFRDVELGSGHRIVLPDGQDLPMLCFRIAEADGGLLLVETDKFGVELRRLNLDRIEAICFEYTLRARLWWVFRHELHRAKSWYRNPHDQATVDRFRDYLLRLQKGAPEEEPCLAGFIGTAEEVSVSA